MELVGDILKKTREGKKISLSNVSKELKISEESLSNLENNYLQKDIDRVFIIGHLRSYCSLLDLNHNEIIELYKLQHFPLVKKNIEIEKPKFEYKFLYSNKLISLSLMLLIFGSFYFLFIEVEKPSREYAIIPDLPENYIAIVEEANLNDLVNNIDTSLSPEKNFAEIESSSNSSSAIASISDNEFQKPSIVTLKFLDDTWVQLRDKNDEIILSQLMNEGDEYSYNIFNNYSITSGNAGHILVMINQKVKGKIGKKGQVVDSLVINKNFNN
jgi:cytoskeletal protein RodZ